MKNIAILGSTGSIGESALKVAREFRARFRIVGLSAGSDGDKLYKQIREFKPLFVSVCDESLARSLKRRISPRIRIFSGSEGAVRLVREKEIDCVLMAISGSEALLPLLSAIECRKQVALANKEALVMAGELIMSAIAKSKAKILPIDSEQSAIWQCLEGNSRGSLKRIFLTASGGPFKDMPKSAFTGISLKDVLRHPRWKMGRKITVDSATMMNKGLEVIEAMHLFGVPCGKIKVLIHPEAIIHSMVEFADGAVIAQLSQTDMRIPIQYALTYPERLKNKISGLDFPKVKNLSFNDPDFKKFPSLGLAYEAARELGTLPAVMNAANEIAVDNFICGRIRFNDIPEVTGRVMRKHEIKSKPGLEVILAADSWAREQARVFAERLN
jgi:1-deoxy-D-xylulose-5-phosphate reductoisomerase